jgi:hypothetical protein
MAECFEYLSLTLERGRQPHRALAEALAKAAPALEACDARLLGQFSPQLGWAANEAAVLLRCGAGFDKDAAHTVVLKAEGVAGGAGQTLSLAARPGTADRLTHGGIHVHRWFTVGAADRDEFVQLSAQAWPDFEAKFDARIFGLFDAQQSAADLAVDEKRLLLITRYGDHGVWEASRDPTTEAMQIFARRQALTRFTRAASTLLVAA